MARVKYGAIITEIRGAVGGSIFQSNKYGFTMKNTPNMKLPNSEYVFSKQRFMVQAAQNWRNQSEALRLQYVNYAITFPQYAYHAPTIPLSGYAVYLKWAFINLMVGLPIPSVFDMVSLTFPALNPFMSNDAGELLLGLGNVVVEDNQRYAVFVSGVVPATINFPPSAFRYVKLYTLEDEPFNVASIYLANFGRLPLVGENVFVRVVPFAVNCPQVMSELFFKITVV